MSIAPNMTDYDAVRRAFKLDVPEWFNFTVDVFEKWAADPGRVALLIGSAGHADITSHTFDALRRRVNQCCNLLRRLGLVRGQRVILLSGWCVEWYVVLLALIKMGVVAIPTTTQSRPRDLTYRVEKSRATAVFCAPELRGVVDTIVPTNKTLKQLVTIGPAPAPWVNLNEALDNESEEMDDWSPTRGDDPMLIYFTSGTVAYPKMVLHTQASFGIGHMVTARFWHDLRENDVHWTLTDTGWAKAAWGCLFGQWTMGATLFVSQAPKFEPQMTLTMLGRAKVTSFCAPPTVYRILVRENLAEYDLASVRHCTSAGEPLNPEVIRIWQDSTGAQIYDGYGQTETVNVLANYRCMPVKPGSMGKPTPTFDVAIVDEEGHPLADGNEGHLAIRVKPHRPVGFFHGYVDDPEMMASAFRGDWYYTGDRAYRDSDGYFWFVGRADDVIITSGYRIGPFEVESALLEHPAVRESAVVASPNELRGEIVKAFVVLREGFEPSKALVTELQQHVRSVTAPYKYPRAVEFVKELPKTISGKIKRGDLKRREWAAWKPTARKRRRRPRMTRTYRTYRRLGLRGMFMHLWRKMVRSSKHKG